jgi:hypothetical protein
LVGSLVNISLPSKYVNAAGEIGDYNETRDFSRRTGTIIKTPQGDVFPGVADRVGFNGTVPQGIKYCSILGTSQLLAIMSQ